MRYYIIAFTIVLVAIGLSIFQTKESNATAINVRERSDIMQKSNSASITDSISIGSDLSLKEVQQLIDLHNKIRADVGVAC